MIETALRNCGRIGNLVQIGTVKRYASQDLEDALRVGDLDARRINLDPWHVDLFSCKIGHKAGVWSEGKKLSGKAALL